MPRRLRPCRHLAGRDHQHQSFFFIGLPYASSNFVAFSASSAARSGGAIGAAAAEEEHARLAELPEIKEQMNRMLLAHYESWLTTEIPALGNRRPVDAVRDAEGRERVAALVLQIERDGRRMNPPLDAAIVGRLRERLGLTAELPPPC